MSIHSSSIVDSLAKIGNGVKIGPFCIVGPNVVLGDNVELKSHVVIDGFTTIGANTVIYPFASIGHAPQDLKYSGEDSRIVIGTDNTLREYVTVQPGTAGGGMVTEIGNNNLLMLGTHIAHDCKVGNRCIFANLATLAGHVHVGDGAVLGGLAAVRQFVRIGTGAMIGGVTAVVQDVLPYTTVAGDRAAIEGVNILGMKRRGFDLDEVKSVQNAVDHLFSDSGILSDKIAKIQRSSDVNSAVNTLLDFMSTQNSKLGYCAPRNAKSPERG
jgi:UDP-N-acetylglucosamine acyltransferase